MPPPPTLVICTPGPEFSWLWVNSWTHFLPRVVQTCRVYNCFSTGNNIYHVRNQCAREAANLVEGVQNLDYVLWIDNDNLFHFDWFQEQLRILENMPEVAGVGAWYLAQTSVRGDSKIAACNIDTSGAEWVDRYVTHEQIQHADRNNELIEVDCLGFGFFLMRGNVLKDLGDHPFTPLISPGGVAWGDDASFLMKARAQGHRFFLHPKMHSEHIKSLPLPLEFYK